MERALSYQQPHSPTCTTTSQAVPETSQFICRAGSWSARKQLCESGKGSLHAATRALLKLPEFSQGRCAAATTEGQTKLGCNWKRGWGRLLPVPVLQMYLDVGMQWHTGFLGKGKRGNSPEICHWHRRGNCRLLELGFKQGLWPGFCSRHRQNLLFSLECEARDPRSPSWFSNLSAWEHSCGHQHLTALLLAKKAGKLNHRPRKQSCCSWWLLYSTVLQNPVRNDPSSSDISTLWYLSASA